MAISLVKGQKISLEKESGTSLSKIVMGLGWDVEQKKGLFGFGGGTPKSIDLDASCIMFNADKKPVDIVYFGSLKSKDGSIIHTGDNRTGEGDGDDEQLIVDLSKVSPDITILVFTINSYEGQTFNQVSNAYSRIVNASNNSEIARYTLTGGGDNTAMVMAKVYRHNGEWKMHAVGEPSNGRTVDKLMQDVVKII